MKIADKIPLGNGMTLFQFLVVVPLAISHEFIGATTAAGMSQLTINLRENATVFHSLIMTILGEFCTNYVQTNLYKADTL